MEIDCNKGDNACPFVLPFPQVPVKLVAQVMFRLKFLEALMNMSRSRFGCRKCGGDVRVKVNNYFVQKVLAPAVKKWLNTCNIPKNKQFFSKNKNCCKWGLISP